MTDDIGLRTSFKNGLGAGCGCLAAPVVGLIVLLFLTDVLSDDSSTKQSDYQAEQNMVADISATLAGYDHVQDVDYSDFLNRWTIEADRNSLIAIDQLHNWHSGFCSAVRTGGMTSSEIELAIVDYKACGDVSSNSCAVLFEGSCN